MADRQLLDVGCSNCTKIEEQIKLDLALRLFNYFYTETKMQILAAQKIQKIGGISDNIIQKAMDIVYKEEIMKEMQIQSTNSSFGQLHTDQNIQQQLNLRNKRRHSHLLKIQPIDKNNLRSTTGITVLEPENININFSFVSNSKDLEVSRKDISGRLEPINVTQNFGSKIEEDMQLRIRTSDHEKSSSLDIISQNGEVPELKYPVDDLELSNFDFEILNVCQMESPKPTSNSSLVPKTTSQLNIMIETDDEPGLERNEIEPKENWKNLSLINSLNYFPQGTLLTKVGDFLISEIRLIIMKFYQSTNKAPNLEEIIQKIRLRDEKFPSVLRHETTLQALLCECAGFYLFRECSLIIEKTRVYEWRLQYLNKLKEFRASGRPIFYSWIKIGYTKSLSWKSCVLSLITGKPDGTEDLSLFALAQFASERDGTLTQVQKMTVPDGMINDKYYKKWLKTLVDATPDNSVIVIGDYSPYHSKWQASIPNNKWSIEDTEGWLMEKGLTEVQANQFLADNSRTEEVIQKFASKHTIPKDFGKKVLLLPPHHHELNPIEYLFQDVKKTILEKLKFIQLWNSNFDMQDTITETYRTCSHTKWNISVKKVLVNEDLYADATNVLKNKIIRKFISTKKIQSAKKKRVIKKNVKKKSVPTYIDISYDEYVRSLLSKQQKDSTTSENDNEIEENDNEMEVSNGSETTNSAKEFSCPLESYSSNKDQRRKNIGQKKIIEICNEMYEITELESDQEGDISTTEKPHFVDEQNVIRPCEKETEEKYKSVDVLELGKETIELTYVNTSPHSSNFKTKIKEKNYKKSFKKNVSPPTTDDLLLSDENQRITRSLRKRNECNININKSHNYKLKRKHK